MSAACLHVGPYRQDITARGCQGGLGRGQSLLVAPADGHRGALGHESLRQGQAEPVRPPGDQHDLARQLEIH